MSQRSRIETELSPGDKAEFDRLLATGRLTVDGLTTWLEGKGYEISRSAVGRYKKNVDRVAERLRQSREMAETLVKGIGEGASDGKQGRLLTEIMRSLMFEHLMAKVEDADAAMEPQDLFFLGKTIKELAQAGRLDQDFEVKVRDRVLAEQKRQLEKVEAEMDAEGTKDPREVLRRIREEVYGIVS